MEIKTAEEMFKESTLFMSDFISDNLKKRIVTVMQEYAKQFLDYASENVEADYNIIDTNLLSYEDLSPNLEVYIKQGEFDKIKELIK